MEGIYKNEQFHSINKDGKIFIELGIDWGSRSMAVLAADYEEDIVSGNLKKGFTISTTRPIRILQYASIYEEVYFPFVYKGNYYATACKSEGEWEKKYAIIDTTGTCFPGFEFKHKYLKLNRMAKDDGQYYFYALTGNDKELFISTEGEEIVIREKKNPLANPNDILRYNVKNFGYTLYDGGLYDLIRMEWVIDNPTFHMIEIEYSSDKKINENLFVSYLYRNRVKLYVKVEDNSYPYPYYIDIKGNKYLP